MTTTPTPDLLYVAELVTKCKASFEGDRVVIHADIVKGPEPWNPSLTGTDRERLQALDCIVAANKNHHEGFITRLALGDDELSAALLALMEGRGI